MFKVSTRTHALKRERFFVFHFRGDNGLQGDANIVAVDTPGKAQRCEFLTDGLHDT